MQKHKFSEISLFQQNSSRLKKKSNYSKKTANYILKLKSFLSEKQIDSINKIQIRKFDTNELTVMYSVCLFFFPTNSFLYVIDASGCLKFVSSAGSFKFKGKAKRSRFQVLKFFFKEIQKLKRRFLKNKPISLYLHNVGFYKRLLVRKLKKKLFIKITKNYQHYPYNGCRKKKFFRK